MSSHRADAWDRILAGIIDGLIAAGGACLFVLPGLVYTAGKDSFSDNQSIGRSRLGIEVRTANWESMPTRGQLFARNLTRFLLGLFTLGLYAIVDVIVFLGRPDGRSITDLIFGTMVYAKPATPAP